MALKISNAEFEFGLLSLGSLAGARLQEVSLQQNLLHMIFFQPAEGLVAWLFDLSPAGPAFFPLAQVPKLKGKVKRAPLELFLRAHLVNRHLNGIHWDETFGRVFKMDFGESDEGPTGIEFRLFPHGLNVIAIAAGKKVALERPKDLVPVAQWYREAEPPRSWPDIEAEWMAANRPAQTQAQTPAQAPASPRTQALKKLQKAEAKIQEDLKKKKESPWRAVADHLVQTQSLNVPEEWRAHIDTNRPLSWNIQHCYEKAKGAERKSKGSAERLAMIQQQIQTLLQAADDEVIPSRISGATKSNSKTQTKAADSVRGRTLHLQSGHIFFVGKNAAENLKLLRQASAWDLWLHLRDYPGSHGILHRQKGDKIPDVILSQAAAFLVEQTFKEKARQHHGDKFDVLVAEVRYVRPIKGDKLGRVTYSHERVLTARFK